MTNTAATTTTTADRIARPHGIRMKGALSNEPIRRYATWAAAVAEAARMARSQGRTWEVTGPRPVAVTSRNLITAR